MSHLFPLRKTLPALRRLAVAAVVIAGTVGLARAQQCAPVEAERFIEQGVASVASGELQGTVLRGLNAVSFGADIGVKTETVLAVFLLKAGDNEMLIVVFRAVDGSEVACAGTASPTARAAVEKYSGRKS